jgi:phage repressor protein C with HTH and peptisase S24 domain
METHLTRELKRLMAERGWSARELSARAGLGESAVKEILSGRSRSPRSDTVAKLARALDKPAAALMGEAESEAHRSVMAPSEAVAEVEVSLSAGGGALPDGEQVVAEWRFPAEWLRGEMRAAPNNLWVVTVEGDSMAPALTPGDKVVIDVSRRIPSPPGIFALWDGLALVVKRLEFIQGSEPPRVRIISDNEHYRPYERTCDEVKIVGRIRGRWQRL